MLRKSRFTGLLHVVWDEDQDLRAVRLIRNNRALDWLREKVKFVVFEGLANSPESLPTIHHPGVAWTTLATGHSCLRSATVQYVGTFPSPPYPTETTITDGEWQYIRSPQFVNDLPSENGGGFWCVYVRLGIQQLRTSLRRYEQSNVDVFFIFGRKRLRDGECTQQVSGLPAKLEDKLTCLASWIPYSW